MDAQATSDSGKRVAWNKDSWAGTADSGSPGYFSQTHTKPAMTVSAANSSLHGTPAGSPPISSPNSNTNFAEMNGTPRPRAKRMKSAQKSRHSSRQSQQNPIRQAQSVNSAQQSTTSDGLIPPTTAMARLTLRTQNNLRMWYLRHHICGSSRRRNELETMREIERSQMLFYQAFVGTPMVLIGASSLRPSEIHEKRVPVVLQQLSIRVTEEQSKHYRNIIRIHLEYGSGLGLVRWEILRGYRDLLYLRTKLTAHNTQMFSVLNRKVKLPKLPRPRAFGLLEKRRHGHDLYHHHNLIHPHNNQHNNNNNNPEVVLDEVSDAEIDSDEEYSYGEDYDDDLDEYDDDLLREEEREQAQIVNDLRYDLPRDEPEEPTELTVSPLLSPRRHGGGHSTAQSRTTSLYNGSTHHGSMHNGSIHTSSRRPSSGHGHAARAAAAAHQESQRSYATAVEKWLNEIKHIYCFRSDSNELMQFLELSHISLKLAPEYTFHGKEGTMIVRSRASELGWNVNHFQLRGLKDMIDRHMKKWVLIRDSYLVIVNNIYSTKIREVFFADQHFEVKHITENQGTEVAEAMEDNNLDRAIEAIPDALNVEKRTRAKSVFLHLTNNERSLKLAAMSARDLRRWQASILQMKARTPWTRKHRFDSFAPVRQRAYGQWFVDGRDYMWVLSEALENARDTIYILDWWLSPELYLRRPPEGNQKWRLDRVLKRKAQQGVKIFVIVYRNVGPTIPIDSLWTKHCLLNLHENIHVMRSPNQLTNKSSLFWAHHEKLCVVDSTIAFSGGIDLCFGRWDTWEHTLTDDAPAPFLPSDPSETEWSARTQLFPGKDYSNARVKDFFELNKPYEDMYDRNNVPRMPWHDIHQMVVGQPARDLCRHFVQRWNYVIRQKIPSRPTPLLLPPPDFSQEDLDRLQLTGTCEYQVLRSSGPWSLGLKHHEQSIQNAYLQLIEESEHLVYIENQFFVTSTVVDGEVIENQIGNALVQRIVRAHENGEKWKAFIVIPLMPGFEAEVDSDKASSVRVICQCQFNSISRGPHSIFYKLEQLGIRPDQYIHFLSLRKWGKFSDTPESPNGGRIATELLYIHAKCMVVDDRIAIIGSANINERSQRGTRDSEIAVCVRDTLAVDSTMNGKPYKKGKFAYTLRMRLMREHLGVDIDKLQIVERFMSSMDTAAERIKRERQQKRQQQQQQHMFSQNGYASSHTPTGTSPTELGPNGHAADPRTGYFDGPVLSGQGPPQSAGGKSAAGASERRDSLAGEFEQFPDWLYPELHSFNWYAGTSTNRGIHDNKKISYDKRVQHNAEHEADVDGEGFDSWKARQSQEKQSSDRRYQAAEPDIEMEKEARKVLEELVKDRSIKSRDQFQREFYSRFANRDIVRQLRRAGDLPMPHVDEEALKAVNCENIPVDPWFFEDPVSDRFVNDVLLAAAERNTLIYRLVFRCQPDDEVETWKDYKTYAAHIERFYEKQKEDGGPNVLRQSGHHEPERVNKLVLSGDIKQRDPTFIEQQRQKAAAHASHPHRRDSDSQHQLHDVDSHSQDPDSSRNVRSLRHAHNRSQAPALDPTYESQEEPEDEHKAPNQREVLDHGVEFTSQGEQELPQIALDCHGNRQRTSVYVDAPESHHEHHSIDPQHLHNKLDYRILEARQQALHPELRHHHRHPLEYFEDEIKEHTHGNQEEREEKRNEDGSASFPEIENCGVLAGEANLAPTSTRRRQTMSGNGSLGFKSARKWGHFDHVLDAQVAEDMLQGITGHLVVFPTEWLNRELESGNWNFQLDLIAPLEIYD